MAVVNGHVVVLVSSKMSSQFCYSAVSFGCAAQFAGLRPDRVHSQAYGCISARQGEGGLDYERDEEHPKVVLVEKYANGTRKRYVLDDNARLKIILEEPGSQSKKREAPDLFDDSLQWLPIIVKDFIFPSGFPGSVSDDYLEYMLLQFPTNVTAWICHALAVGVGSFSGSTAAASAAAIRQLANTKPLFPFFCIFDLTTPLYPAYFLPLASLGNLAKAVARGLKDPSFRVIQNHFAISGNLGDISAKEEVWEVAAQLLGLALGVIFLDTPGVQKSYPLLVCTWTGMRMLHLWLRYKSLSVLRFDTINMKRARILIESHILKSKLPGSADCNRKEDILQWERFLKPRIIFGVSLEDMLQGERSKYKLKELIKLYEKECYILVANQNQRDLEVYVSFKVGATSLSALRSVWQAFWINQNWTRVDSSHHLLEQSVMEMDSQFGDFIQQLEGAGLLIFLGRKIEIEKTQSELWRKEWCVVWEEEEMRRSFKDSLKALEADIQHANTLASIYSKDYDGGCIQMRLSYSPAAHLFLFLVQWTNCYFAGTLGLLRILIYKSYVDGKTTMTVHERKATLREFYGVIFPSLMQMEGGINDLEERKQKEICAKYKRRDEMNKGKLSEIDVEREEECGICMEMTNKVVLPNCNHSMCEKCYREWRTRSQSCPFCRDSLKRVNSGELWIYTCYQEIADLSHIRQQNMKRLKLYIDKLPLIVPEPVYVPYDPCY
ncbi:unnamed protein product [Rhodiola kirilowii]